MKQETLFNFHTDGFGKVHYDPSPSYPDVAGYKEHTTSKKAALKVRASADEQRETVRRLFIEHKRLTAKEATRLIFGYSSDVVRFYADEINPVRSRMSELTESGFLTKTDEEKEKSKVYEINEGKHILEIGK